MSNNFFFQQQSNYGFHLAGPWGLFLKAAKNCFILLNGSVALKFVIGQPQRTVSPLQLTSSLPARSFYSKPRGRSTSPAEAAFF